MKTMLLATLFGVFATTGQAAEKKMLGYTRILNNDVIGDARDRWRTGSYQISAFRGEPWTGARPQSFGDLIEFRLRGEIIAPANIVSPAVGDRLYAGTYAFGVHSYSENNGREINLGVGVAVVGPQTGLADLQAKIHDLVGVAPPAAAGFEVGNSMRPTAYAEVGQNKTLAGNSRVRPFVELQAGLETLARIGVDFTIGGYGKNDLLIRDVVTGQRMPGIMHGSDKGISLIVGADVAYVADSIYLPRDLGYQLSDVRLRARAGVNYEVAKGAVFYGVSYLSEEFRGQPNGQVVGSFTWRRNF